MTWVCLLHEALPESHLTPKWLILYAKLNEFGGHAGHLLRHVKMLLNFPIFFFGKERFRCQGECWKACALGLSERSADLRQVPHRLGTSRWYVLSSTKRLQAATICPCDFLVKTYFPQLIATHSWSPRLANVRISGSAPLA